MIRIAWHPVYVLLLPEKHRFPMEKYKLLYQQLLYEGTFEDANFFQPQYIAEEDILRIHTEEYFQKLQQLNFSRKEQLRIGFPLSQQLYEREMIIAGGSLEASKYALQNGIAFNIAGGTHHAFADRGEGFCLLNDIAISAVYLLENQLIQQALIIDLDVHQGNGTAKIFENEANVFTFSMHGEHNYPLRKEKSDLDVGVVDGIKGAEYLEILQQYIPNIIDQIKPDFIFYLSGVDVLETDKLGRLGLTVDDCKKRDQFVLEAAFNRNIPTMVSMGGGYSKEIKYIIEAHANTFRLAKEIWEG